MTPLRYTRVEPISTQHYLGKRFYVEDGLLRKEPPDPVGSFRAEIRECADLAAFYDDIKLISTTSNCAIILGTPLGIPVGVPFEIRSKDWLMRKLGAASRQDILGVHTIDGKTVVGRLKENFEFSRIALLDYDTDENTPVEHAHDMVEDYLAAMAQVFPAFANAGVVVTASSSSGLVGPDGTLLSAATMSKRHVFFVVDDPLDIPRFKDALMYHAVLADMSWPRPEGGNGTLRRYLFDPSVFSIGRLVYEGMPQLNDGIAQVRDAPLLIDGGSIDTASLPSATQTDLSQLHRSKGIATKVVQDSKTGKRQYSGTLSESGTRIPKLTLKTRFVRDDDRHTERTVEEFLASGDDELRVITEFLCDLADAPRKSGASEVLLKSEDGKSCILYEHDGEITYCFPNAHREREYLKARRALRDRSRVAQPVTEQADEGEFFFGEEFGKFTRPTVTLGDKDLSLGSTHLVFGRPGQGKSVLAGDLANDDRAVIFACASNEQAEAQYAGYRHDDKELVLSRPYQLKQQYGVEVIYGDQGDPFEAPDVDEDTTLLAMVAAKVVPNLDTARTVWESLGSGVHAPNLSPGRIIFTTLERARVWARTGYFRPSPKSSPAHQLLLRRAVLFVDDVDREAISDYRLITDEVRAWMNREQAKTGRKFETKATGFGNEYLIRQPAHSIRKGFEVLSTIYTTVEDRARIMLERRYGAKLRVHDMSPPADHIDSRANLYLIGADTVRANLHALFHPLAEVWNTRLPEWVWVADGVGSIENHYTVRGKNEYSNSNLLVKLSQPHPDAIDKAILDLGMEDGNSNAAKAVIMLDALVQAAGRNQGDRFQGKCCVVLVDPRYVGVLSELCGFETTVVGALEDIDPADVKDADVRWLLRTVIAPITSIDETLKGGLAGWLSRQADAELVQKVSDARDVRNGMAANQDAKTGALISRVLTAILAGTSWRDVERSIHPERLLDADQRKLLRRAVTMGRLVLEAKASLISASEVSMFERNRNWRRKLDQAEDRKVLRHVLRTNLPS